MLLGIANPMTLTRLRALLPGWSWDEERTSEGLRYHGYRASHHVVVFPVWTSCGRQERLDWGVLFNGTRSPFYVWFYRQIGHD